MKNILQPLIAGKALNSFIGLFIEMEYDVGLLFLEHQDEAPITRQRVQNSHLKET